MSLTEAANVIQSMPKGLSADKLTEIAGGVQRVAILKTLWYPEIMGAMESSAREFLRAIGIPDESVECLSVPGSFELPLAVLHLSESAHKRVPLDFAIALGCIVRGETPHFDFVSAAATQGLMRVQLDLKTPIGFGVLTVDTLDQARSRAEKGAEAAQAAFYMHVNKCLSNWGWKE